ncbi:hypothetical protein GWI33_003011 [Rhynchophorus ferrugineus]|uniref:Uncharacterized protein n=1 Tax=Rhynchophorus ferrugineus TaxID=354439 RepID=A0A834MHB3_RHYFE|nr:hypothetical protein GWI33_003011 [Rhynchophorus ferrugineus]
MKLIVFLALAALAQSYPYYSRWHGVGSIYSPDVDLRWTLGDRPWVTRDPVSFLSSYERPVAEERASRIIGELGREDIVDIERAIDRLDREEHIASRTNNPKTARAVSELRQELREKPERLDEIRRVDQLKDTLEAAIEAQLTTDNVESLTGPFSKTADQDNIVFEARIKKLIDRCTIADIQTELTKQHKIIRQLEEQERFLEQEKQQLEAQKTIVTDRGHATPARELRVAEERIREEQRRLVSEKYARFLVIRMLRARLYAEEDKLVRDSISKDVRQDVAEDRRDYARRGFLRMDRDFYDYPRRCAFGFCY